MNSVSANTNSNSRANVSSSSNPSSNHNTPNLAKLSVPRVLFAAPSSGGGKTTVVCGMLCAMMQRGLKTVGFKCGPDYIDPMFHRSVLGSPSFNIDLFFMNEAPALSLVAHNSCDKEIAIIEGVMGFYDGMSVESTNASAYHVAKVTKTPVILVVDAKGASLSIAATIKGFIDMRPDNNICGVILNRVSRSMCEMLAPIIKRECGIKLLGCLPQNPEYSLESRHLGLISASEVENLRDKIGLIARSLEENVDIDAVIEIANSAQDVACEPWCVEAATNPKYDAPVIAVAQDLAFCFYYSENLQMLKDLGAKIVSFSPINDDMLPSKTSAIYLGGGYPELYAKKLESNISMRKSILEACKNGIPVFAECGGFMYLQNSLEDLDNNTYQMVGFIDSEAKYTGKLTRFGYVNLKCKTGGGFCEFGEEFPAHEFHYYNSSNNGNSFFASKPSGRRSWECFVQENNVLAGYPHVYFPAAQSFAKRFVEAAYEYSLTHTNTETEKPSHNHASSTSDTDKIQERRI